MKLKKLTAWMLSVAIAINTIMVSSVATTVTQSLPFQDITNATTAECAEVLRLLGIVNGTDDGQYSPDKTLTRGEFCKIAIELMGLGDQALAQSNRTIFLDVGATHWARGYINLASTLVLGEGDSATRLMMGLGDGTFAPDRAITYGESVTILMRVLGYGDNDATSGVFWYDGYLSLGSQVSLTDGIALTGDATLTRGDAALLFYNLLFSNSKGGKEAYYTTLGVEMIEGGIILDVDATTIDGWDCAIQTTNGLYKTYRTDFSSYLEGTKSDLMVDEEGNLIALFPEETHKMHSITVSEWGYNYVVDENQEKISIPPSTTLYLDGEETTFETIYLDQKTGLPLTIYYTYSGSIDYLFLRTTQLSTDAMVAKNQPNGVTNPFVKLTENTSDYQMMKSGLPATAADIRQYDVATFDDNTNTLHISDLRLSGIYENVYPSPSTPVTITVMGASFQVLPTAATDLQSFSLGDEITLLLTADGQVGGVVPTTTAASTTVGVVTTIDTSGNATVTPLNDMLPEFSGTSIYTESNTSKVEGQLVTISSSATGRITLSRLSTSGAKADFNVGNGTVGDRTLSSNVTIYDQVGNGIPQQVALSDVTANLVEKADILYMSTDYANRIDILVLNDVTGDCYTYGFPVYTAATTSVGDLAVGTNPTISVTNGDEGFGPLICGIQFQKNTFYGIAASQTIDNGSGLPKLANAVPLMTVEGVSCNGIDTTASTIETNTMVLPIAKDVQCYNNITKTWFNTEDIQGMDAVNLVRAFTDTITIHYDNPPEEGGKVRVIVVG